MGGEGDDRGWDGWIASLTQWTWVGANSRRWWRTGSLGCCSQWGHKELNTTEWTTTTTIMKVRTQMPWVIFALSQFRHCLFENVATSTMTLRISKYRPIHNSQWCNLSLWSEFQLPVYLELKLSLWKANRKAQDKWGQLTMISRGLLKIPHSLALSYYWFMPSHVKEGFVLHSD